MYLPYWFGIELPNKSNKIFLKKREKYGLKTICDITNNKEGEVATRQHQEKNCPIIFLDHYRTKGMGIFIVSKMGGENVN
jgi:hypothetical protein